jgi:polysaccharide export outer membrane protein
LKPSGFIGRASAIVKSSATLRQCLYGLLIITISWYTTLLCAAEVPEEYLLGPADVLHITVFENPELTSDVRVSETGTITFPLIGAVPVVGLTVPQAQAAIAKKLKDGQFVAHAQVTILPTLIRGSQVTVVGYVNKPGRYPLETTNTHISDVLAAAGGVNPMGSDTIILIQHHDGAETRKSVDLNELFVKGSLQDEQVHGGDTLYVPRESFYYIYGEVQKPGQYRLERHMTVMQGLAVGGYSNERGSQWRTQIFRQDDDGAMHEVELNVADVLKPNDVIYVRVRIF